MSKLTPELVRDLHQHMVNRYGAFILNKSTTTALRDLGTFLEKLGVTNFTEHLNQYCTTIGRTIYLSYDPGDDSSGWSLPMQVATIAHECTHVTQFMRDPLEFATQYVSNSEARAGYEAHAYRCNIEVLRWLGEEDPGPALAEYLQGYSCKPEEIEMARYMLADIYPTAERGGFTNPHAFEAVTYLKSRGFDPTATDVVA